MENQRLLRAQIVDLLRGGNAHMGFDEAVADFPEALINGRPANVEYTFWHLIEHVRLCQVDLLNYVTDADYQEPVWPDELWPARDAQATTADWAASLAAFHRDLDAFVAIIADEATDLFAGVPSHAEHTILREALILADHNAYHTGELAILRQVERGWGAGQTE
jgi:hypothetical protein